MPHYDFNWQLAYRLREPLSVKKGEKLIATAWYDNSAKNPANPDPAKTVRFGEQTTDEMMIGYFDWVPERMELQSRVSPAVIHIGQRVRVRVASVDLAARRIELEPS